MCMLYIPHLVITLGRFFNSSSAAVNSEKLIVVQKGAARHSEQVSARSPLRSFSKTASQAAHERSFLPLP